MACGMCPALPAVWMLTLGAQVVTAVVEVPAAAAAAAAAAAVLLLRFCADGGQREGRVGPLTLPVGLQAFLRCSAAVQGQRGCLCGGACCRSPVRRLPAASPSCSAQFQIT